MLYIFDTKQKLKVELKPEKANTIRMYTCGPTVYNFAHIGNLRTYVFEDVLRRAIKFFGMKVFHVMNLTDVDDKTILGSQKAKLPLREFTKKYKDAFFQDLKTLNVESAEAYPAATDYIPQMIKIIQGLVDKGYAYEGQDGNIFYRITKFPKYGELSHFCLEDLKVGASERVHDEYDKENISDFVLWKAYDAERDGDVVWDSPWGKGRPGWHIECSAMAMHCLGETLDLHVGGSDNIFPHHENEIAQSEAYTGKVFSRHWMHSAHLVVDGKKMSKSLGNFYVLGDLLAKGFSGREVRFLLMSTHYRIPLNFTFAGLEAAQNSLRRIDDFVDRLKSVGGEDKENVDIEEFEREFRSFVSDDLNVSGALGVLFDFIRKVNTMCDQNLIGKKEAEKILEKLKSIDMVLGVIERGEVHIPLPIQELFKERNQARKDKKWALADTLRKQIEESGFLIEDSPTGSCLKRK